MREEIEIDCASALNEREVAQLINVSVGLVRKLRRRKDGPRWLRLGRCVRYLRRDIEVWLESRAATGSAEVDRDERRDRRAEPNVE